MAQEGGFAMKQSRIYDEEAHSGALLWPRFREVPAGDCRPRSGRFMCHLFSLAVNSVPFAQVIEIKGQVALLRSVKCLQRHLNSGTDFSLGRRSKIIERDRRCPPNPCLALHSAASGVSGGPNDPIAIQPQVSATHWKLERRSLLSATKSIRAFQPSVLAPWHKGPVPSPRQVSLRMAIPEPCIHLAPNGDELENELITELNDCVHHLMFGTVIGSINELVEKFPAVSRYFWRSRRHAQNFGHVIRCRIFRKPIDMVGVHGAIQHLIVVVVVERLRQLDHESSNHGMRERPHMRHTPPAHRPQGQKQVAIRVSRRCALRPSIQEGRPVGCF
jgi:hypothetical protein